MGRTLELIFETAAQKAVTLTVDEPRTDLTASELAIGMQAIISNNVFEVGGSPLAIVKGARVVDRNVQEYEV